MYGVVIYKSNWKLDENYMRKYEGKFGLRGAAIYWFWFKKFAGMFSLNKEV